jgi:hypothetical protein
MQITTSTRDFQSGNYSVVDAELVTPVVSPEAVY